MRLLWMAGVAGAMMGGQQGSRVEPIAAPSKTPVVLVELFTSEGCSSCPPADQMLQQIDGKRTQDGALIVGISEHVTYWDHIGWKDPFGSETTTDRQSEYGGRFKLGSVYTPQMVVNGETQLVGNDGKGITRALQTAHTQNAVGVQISSAQVQGGFVEAKISVNGTVPSRGADVLAVIAEDETTMRVSAGENEGRRLSHTSVARVLVKVGKVNASGDMPLRLKLPGADSGSRRRLIVWVQEPGQGHVLGVDSQAF